MKAELTSRDTVLQARQAVDAYRQAHRILHSKRWHKGVPEEHTPLLEQLIAELERIGYTGTGKDILERAPGVLKKAFACSRELNVKDLGFIDTADFDANAQEVDILALEEKWQ